MRLSIKLNEFLNPEPWQLKFLFQLGGAGWIAHMLVVSLTASLQGLGQFAVQFWLAGMLLLSLSMIAICLTGARSAHPRLFGLAHTIATSIVAVFWARGALSFAQASFEHLLLYTFALGGTALGAVSAQHAVLRSCFASIWLSIPFLALAHIQFDPTWRGQANGTMILLFGVVISMLSVRTFSVLRANHELSQSLNAQIKLSEKERARADAANAAKSRFIAYASHDLRQPVHAIRMLARSMEQASLTDDNLHSVQQIESCAVSLSQQFQSLMDLSALELGKIKPECTDFSLKALLGDLVEQNWQGQYGWARFNLLGDDAVVRTDRALLSAILQNLVTNALKYAPDSVVLLGLKQRGDNVSLIVGDRGPGIAQTFQTEAFQDFTRATDADLPGLGLGLSLVQRYCETLDLDVRVWSEMGRGTLFEIGGLRRIAQLQQSAVQTPKHGRLHGLRVLLVAPIPDMQKQLNEQLRALGCEVMLLAKDMADAIDVALLPGELDEATLGDLEQLYATRPFVPVLVGENKAESPLAFSTTPHLTLQAPIRPARLRSTLIAASLQVGEGN
jgi:signal transduction histidine kinase